ncbi:hypothetical protein F2Q70_00027752, partial [Brassica cretica]
SIGFIVPTVSAEEIGNGITQDHHIILKVCSKGQQQKPIKLCSQMLHSSLFPPGQLALAALRIANGVLGVVDFDRYLEKNVSQPKSERTRLQTSQICLMTSNLW